MPAPPGGRRDDRRAPRIHYLPVALALGLFVGDIVTMLLRDALALGRVAVSGLISIVVYVGVRWYIRRPGRSS